MTLIGEMIAAGGRLGLMYAERLLTGIKPAQFARLARPGGQMIQTNHPAFVFGHLALYPPRVLAALGKPADAIAISADWEPLFKNGAECRDDVEGTIYPAMAPITEAFFSGYRAAIEAVTGAAEEQFARPNPAEGRLRELFPTIGSAINFYLGGHVQNHLGQLSAWRRAVGLPPV